MSQCGDRVDALANIRHGGYGFLRSQERQKSDGAARKLKISSILVGLLLWSVRLRTGGAPEQGSRMAASRSTLEIAPEQPEIPAWLLRVCFALCVVNLTLGVVAYFSHWWIYDSDGLGIPTDFVNVWAAGRLVLDGLPAQAYDWDIQKQIEVATARSGFCRLFCLALSAAVPVRRIACWRSFPMRWRFIGWVLVSILPYLAVMRAIVGRNFGVAARARRSDGVHQCAGRTERFSHGGADRRHALSDPDSSGACRHLPRAIEYKPQYGLLFPIVLIAAGALARVLQRRVSRRSRWSSFPGSPSAPRAGWRSFTGCR